MLAKSRKAKVFAATIAAALWLGTPLPVVAGQVGFSITPKGRDAEVVRQGLQFYSLFRSLRDQQRNRARVDQRGSGNGAAISQSGHGNDALVFQRGRGHEAVVSQQGTNNHYGVFQFGRGTRSSVSQSGNGNARYDFVFGW